MREVPPLQKAKSEVIVFYAIEEWSIRPEKHQTIEGRFLRISKNFACFEIFPDFCNSSVAHAKVLIFYLKTVG